MKASIIRPGGVIIAAVVVLAAACSALANSAPSSSYSMPYPDYGASSFNTHWDLVFWGGIPIEVEAYDPDDNLEEHYVSVTHPDNSITYFNQGGPVESGSYNAISECVYTQVEGSYQIYSHTKDSDGLWNHAPFSVGAYVDY